MGLQGTRPAEVLKLWLGLRQLGIKESRWCWNRRSSGVTMLVNCWRMIDCSCWMAGLHLLAFRPRQDDPVVSARWTEQTRRELMRQGFLLSRPRYGGHHWLKVVLGNPTPPAHLMQLAGLITQQLTD